MKTKFKCCDKKIKVPFGNIPGSYKGISLPDAMFRKYNLNAFSKCCKDIPQNMANYHKAFKKFTNANKFSCANKKGSLDVLPPGRHNIRNNYTNKSSGVNREDNIDIFPASGHDIFSYLAQHNISNSQIQVIMKLDGSVDFEKLKRAVRLSVDVEPVFGCRFVEDDPPYWKRLDNIDEITFCFLEETNNSDEAVMTFLQSPLDMDNDPNVKVKIIRSEQCDILGVKINHTCCDGAGAKKYVQLLSDIYSRIDQGNDTSIPKPVIINRNGQDRLFKELGVSCPNLRWNPLLENSKTIWAFPWIQRGGKSVCFEVCRLPQGSLESIHQYGKARGATVNDLILTAFYRAMFKISKPPYGVPMDISSTVDLRRYLPGHKAQAVRNLSGEYITGIARTMNESFEGTLSKVMDATKKINLTYFHNYLGLIYRTPENTNTAQSPAYISNVCFPELSNLGYISKSLIKFGDNVVTEAYIIPPVIRAPGFLLLASSYNGILTLSTGYYKTSISQRYVEDLLNKIKYELIKGCACDN